MYFELKNKMELNALNVKNIYQRPAPYTPIKHEINADSISPQKFFQEDGILNNSNSISAASGKYFGVLLHIHHKVLASGSAHAM